MKNGGISRKINGLLQCWGGALKKKFVKFVVQDLTSGGHEWMRAKWSAPIRKYWKIAYIGAVATLARSFSDTVSGK